MRHLYHEYRGSDKGDSENVNDDIVFEMELIKQVDFSIDFILQQIKKYQDSHQKDKEIIVNITKTVDSSIELRNKKDLILQFIASLSPSSDVDQDWQSFVEERKITELDKIIADEELNKDETYKFMQSAFINGYIQETGTAITKVLPAVSRFTKSGERSKKRESVLETLTAFFMRFSDIVRF